MVTPEGTSAIREVAAGAAGVEATLAVAGFAAAIGIGGALGLGGPPPVISQPLPETPH